jgi:hypothetical protein
MNRFFVLEIAYDSDLNAGRNRNSSLIPIKQAAPGPALRWYHGNILTPVGRTGRVNQSGGDANDDADHEYCDLGAIYAWSRTARWYVWLPLGRSAIRGDERRSRLSTIRAVIGKMDAFVDNLRFDLVLCRRRPARCFHRPPDCCRDTGSLDIEFSMPSRR